jgi:hypothetical protein
MIPRWARTGPAIGGAFLLCFAIAMSVVLPFVVSIAHAQVSLHAPALALINKFLTTVTPPLSQKRLVAAMVPAVGCPQDGQAGPQEAPMLPKDVRVIIPERVASSLAYYSAGESPGSGVLGPKGWDCFGTYGSGGSTLFVMPRRLGDPILDRFEKLKEGPAVIRRTSIGGTSGRFRVARISARIFPRARPFVERVRKEGLEDPSDYVFVPWDTDQLNRLSDFAVSYVTPVGSDGLGTALGLAPGHTPISGLVLLIQEQADGPFLEELAVRLERSEQRLYVPPNEHARAEDQTLQTGYICN